MQVSYFDNKLQADGSRKLIRGRKRDNERKNYENRESIKKYARCTCMYMYKERCSCTVDTGWTRVRGLHARRVLSLYATKYSSLQTVQQCRARTDLLIT